MEKAIYSQKYFQLILFSTVKNPEGQPYTFGGTVGTVEQARQLLADMGFCIDLEVVD